MKKVVVAVLSFCLLLPPALNWIHVHIHNLSEPTTMIILGFGLLALAGIGKKQLQEVNRNEEKNVIKQKQETFTI